MRYIVVLAALLVTPIAADATLVQDSRDTAVEVTISFAGTVPLAGGDLVLDDTFVLTGTGSAFIRVAPPGPYCFEASGKQLSTSPAVVLRPLVASSRLNPLISDI